MERIARRQPPVSLKQIKGARCVTFGYRQDLDTDADRRLVNGASRLNPVEGVESMQQFLRTYLKIA